MEWITPTLAIVAGLVTGAAMVSGIIVPMIPIRWGLIALWFGMVPLGYIVTAAVWWFLVPTE